MLTMCTKLNKLLSEFYKYFQKRYGRVSQRVCRFQNFNTDKCMSNMNDTISVVKSKCELKQTCQFTVGEALFGNPCQGIYKYVDIKYECVQNDF